MSSLRAGLDVHSPSDRSFLAAVMLSRFNSLDAAKSVVCADIVPLVPVRLSSDSPVPCIVPGLDEAEEKALLTTNLKRIALAKSGASVSQPCCRCSNQQLSEVN